ncbi:FLZ-type domain-containing protein [Heracleum sosnowskyi]|uniref:FLZ-type domain-containing protein n=1 Tax=Heracleum sosnowskyi TaxID=360622 RepID=A0AAD8M4F6_9APIA|nr:FLZ-type domain-containing protein [Heracleum sosnowskyi]
MELGRKEFRRTTSLTEITVNLTAGKQPTSNSPATPKNEQRKSHQEGEWSESPRDYTRMRRRSINIPTPQNYSNTYTDDTPSFLTTCSLCQRRLPPGRDIFMYRGDAAYCSVECREDQMEHDERKEQSSSIINSPSASLAKDHEFDFGAPSF